MWSIVEFNEEDESSVEVVPTDWIVRSGAIKKSFWPPYRKNDRVRQAILKRDTYDENWPIYNIQRIFATAGNKIIKCFFAYIIKFFLFFLSFFKTKILYVITLILFTKFYFWQFLINLILNYFHRYL